MIEKRYIISDAAKKVEVETHVLRYWEDELNIEIPRNEMGHRFYTDFYINIFKKVRELKDGGFQLKAIKMLIPEIIEKEKSGGADVDVLKNELFETIDASDSPETSKIIKEEEGITVVREVESQNSQLNTADKNYKLEQFQEIMNEVVSNALMDNTKELSRQVGDIVSDNVTKELDYLMHLREKQEEERFKKLDETIRMYQNSGKKKNKKIGLFKRT